MQHDTIANLDDPFQALCHRVSKKMEEVPLESDESGKR